MCGIIGVTSAEGSLKHFPIEQITNTLSHRGPDDFGIFTDNHASLGHRRLSIIDQKLFKDVMGNQMSDREKKDFLVFEGRRFLTKRIDLPAYIPFNEKNITNELEEVLYNQGGFSGGMHFDCLVGPVANWLRRRKWGFGKKTQKYSALIRDGQMTREEALEQSEGSDADEEPEILNYFMEMLELTRDDVERAKELSPLNFKHYDPKLIRMIENVFRNP